MKMPKHIEYALDQRAKAADRFTHYDVIVSEWLEKHDLIDYVEEYDIYGGCEAYVNPSNSSARIKAVILNAEEDKRKD